MTEFLTDSGKRRRMVQAIVMLKPRDHARLVKYAESQDCSLSEMGREMILHRLAELEPVYWVEPAQPARRREIDGEG
jgi:hypothetical protein